jgi:large subunit ribosomal protein L22
MEVKASLKHLRMSAQKVRLVIDVIRKMPVLAALDQLQFVNKAATNPVARLIRSAIANGVNTYDLEADNLYIKEIRADEGVTLKRWMPRAHGRATSIRKRGCHISLILAEIKESGKKEKKVVKAADPVKLEKLAADAEKSADPRLEDRRVKGAKADKTSDKGFSAKMFRRKAG